MVKCQVVMDAMERIAPRRLAEDWDNPGLLLGSPAQEVSRIFVCLDVDEAAVDAAVRQGADMIVSHHPLIFRAMKQLRTDLPLGRLLQRLMEHHIAVYAAHTNLDIAVGGVNDVLAGLLGLQALGPLSVTAEEELIKLAVYVPEEYAERVRTAITEAGAGCIGRYSCCTFRVAGEGTFLPAEGTRPFIGEPGRLERVAEVRIETILPAAMEKRGLRAMLRAHPYGEAAYDLYPLKNKGEISSLGRIGLLPETVDVQSFAQKVCAALPASHVRLVAAGDRKVKKVALCSGSGAEFISRAAFLGADVYVTGDVKYHDAQQAIAKGMHVIDAGHFATEYPVVPVLARRLAAELEGVRGDIAVACDTQARDVFSVVNAPRQKS